MSIMIKRWAVTEGFDKGAKVEAYQFSDGSVHYSFRDRLGRSMDLSEKEAEKTIKAGRMQPVFEVKE